ncbi:MAG: ATP-binding protein, partial [Candidatus Hodarchaeota archaeon]
RSDHWVFQRPRKLPDHLQKVYKIGTGKKEEVLKQQECLKELLSDQLSEGIFVGHLLAGETSLEQVPISIPGEYMAHHLGIFGRTGTGKSNNLMVLIDSIYRNNRRLFGRTPEDWGPAERPVSLFAIDPHDEFAKWKGGRESGIVRIMRDMTADERKALVEPFFYLSCRSQEHLDQDPDLGGLGRTVYFSRKDIIPQDIISIMEVSEQMASAAEAIADEFGEDWIEAILNGDVEPDERVIHRATLSALNRRLGFLATGRSNLVPRSETYHSRLPDIVLALEQGRVLDVDTTLVTEVEQFLLTTVVARTIFSMRKALKAALEPGDLADEFQRYLQLMKSFRDEFTKTFCDPGSPYIREDGSLKSIGELPAVNVVVEEAPSILNPARLKFGSIFREIARQGRKFGIGLTIVSQQITEIDPTILSQLNTEITLALGNEDERQAAVRTASNDIWGFKRELQVLGLGQAILTASYKDIPLPIQIPEFG